MHVGVYRVHGTYDKSSALPGNQRLGRKRHLGDGQVSARTNRRSSGWLKIMGGK